MSFTAGLVRNREIETADLYITFLHLPDRNGTFHWKFHLQLL